MNSCILEQIEQKSNTIKSLSPEIINNARNNAIKIHALLTEIENSIDPEGYCYELACVCQEGMRSLTECINFETEACKN